MSSQMGTRFSSYSKAIEELKQELQGHIANLKSATEWAHFERLYRALCTVEELAGAPKTSLEELLGIMPANALESPLPHAAKQAGLEFGDQVETEPATEIEKGS